jgi:small subunit ribosomal protein S20
LATVAPKKKLSVLKRARQNEKRNLRNKSVNSKIKTLVKKVISSVESKDVQEVERSLREAIGAISSAVYKGVLHRNTASRKISRLSKLANRVLKAEAA